MSLAILFFLPEWPFKTSNLTIVMSESQKICLWRYFSAPVRHKFGLKSEILLLRHCLHVDFWPIYGPKY